MKANGTALVALAGMALLAVGVFLEAGLPVALIVVGIILLAAAVADVLLDMRGKA